MRGEASDVMAHDKGLSVEISIECDRERSKAPGLVWRGGIAGGTRSTAIESLCDVIIGGRGLGVAGRDGDELDVCTCLAELRQRVR